MTAAIESDLTRLDVSVDELASKGEFAALSALLADDFVYSHSTGSGAGQAGVARLAQSPWSASATASRTSSRVEMHGDVAVVKGDLDVVWREAPTKYNRYVRIYRLATRRWRAISQVTTPAPERDPAKQ